MDGVNSGASDAGASDAHAIADEFELHVQQCAESLQRQGLSPAVARAEAERRFGDMRRHLVDCRREAPEERMDIRVRRILFVSVGALAAGTVLLLALVWQQGRTIDGFQERIRVGEERMRVMAISSPSMQAVDRAGFQHGVGEPAPVNIEGAPVPRPGAYNVPDSGSIPLGRLLAAAGVRSSDGVSLKVRVLPSRGGEAIVARWKQEGLSLTHSGADGPCIELTLDAQGTHPAVTLRGGELVIVMPIS